MRLIASSVELEPAPAMTGTRPAAVLTHSSTTCRCSSCDSVEASPVVPQGTRQWVPLAIWRSTKATNALSSTLPLRKGVTRAGMDPLKIMFVSGAKAGEPARDSRDNHFMAGFGKQMSRGLRGLLAAVAVSALVGPLGVSAAAENPTAPSLKPAHVVQSTWMEAGEFTLLSRALDAADDNRWSEVKSALGRLNDPGAQALLRWRMATDGNAGMGYADLAKAMEEFKGWPDADKIEELAEQTIRYSGMTADERIAWLKARGPKTGDGVLALADAYSQMAKKDDELAVIRKAWRTQTMSDQAERTIQQLYGGDLSPEDHFARA